jgi:hypothetical protein
MKLSLKKACHYGRLNPWVSEGKITLAKREGHPERGYTCEQMISLQITTDR